VASFTPDGFKIDEVSSGIVASPFISVGNLTNIQILKTGSVVGKQTNLSFSFKISNPISPNSKVELVIPQGVIYHSGALECLVSQSSINGITQCNSSLTSSPLGSYFSKISIELPCPSVCPSGTIFTGEI